MSAIINPLQRNNPCDHIQQEKPEEIPQGETGYYCSRCGADADRPESLCAPLGA